MKILSHRGYWKEEKEKNSLLAFRNSLTKKFGFESDIRDYKGELVISHNPADESSPLAEEVFMLLNQFKDKYCFAINIKADGLIGMLKKQIDEFGISNYFVFDMSVPQMVEYAENKIRFFTRQSEFEREPVMLEQAAGIWIDGFEDNSWITQELLKKYIDMGKEICLVSPELHGRQNKDFWDSIRQMDLDFSKILLCSDIPDDAAEYFAHM